MYEKNSEQNRSSGSDRPSAGKSNELYNPLSFDLKSGIPQLVDIPAPTNTTMFFFPRNNRATPSIVSSNADKGRDDADGGELTELDADVDDWRLLLLSVVLDSSLYPVRLNGGCGKFISLEALVLPVLWTDLLAMEKVPVKYKGRDVVANVSSVVCCKQCQSIKWFLYFDLRDEHKKNETIRSEIYRIPFLGFPLHT